MAVERTTKGIYICYHCLKDFLTPTEFYASNSDIYSGMGYLPICKDCLTKMYKKFLKKYKNPLRAMQRLCMSFDIYYNEDAVKSCGDDPDKVLGSYFRRLNLATHKGKTFDSTIKEGFKMGYGAEPTISKYDEPEVQVVYIAPTNDDEAEIAKTRDIKRWGAGFSTDEYDALNAHYKLLKEANPNCDNNQEMFITDLCYINMRRMKALREGRDDDYGKLSENYRKSFNQAGLRTAQENVNSSDDAWTAWTGIISKYSPEEYYRNKEKYKDYDGLGEYYQRMVVRPMRNLQLGTQERDPEYSIPDEEDDNDE